MQDEYRLVVVAINYPTWWLDDLAVARSLELDQLTPAFGMSLQLPDMLEDTSDEQCSGIRILQRDVVADGIEVAKRWLGPDYLSHRAIRVLA